MSKNFYTRDNCRYCKSKELVEFLDLGDQPPSNSFLDKNDFDKEEYFPLRLSLCKNCYLVQLRDVVYGSDIFDDYYYLSSSSKALVNHFKNMTKDITQQFPLSNGDVVVDIGCNDGITLDAYEEHGICKIGVEPSNAGEIASQKGHIVFKDFFNKNIADKIVEEYGAASVVTATNVFAHVDDMDSFVEGIPSLIKDKGIFVVELSYLPRMFDSNMFDVIYHEHLCYLSLHPLIPFLEKFNLEVFHVEELDMGASGPAIRFFIKHIDNIIGINKSVDIMIEEEKKWGIDSIEVYENFAKRVFEIKKNTMIMIKDIIHNGKTIGGFGAPAKGNTLLNFLQVNDSIIPKISENNTKKIGKYTPGSHIEVISDEDFMKNKYDYALLLAWNYKDFFINNSDYIKKGGKFIIPFPEPHIE